jgi:hypothetical protein
MEPKQLQKVFERMTDKFVSVTVGHTNGLTTEDNVKKAACSNIGTLTRIKNVENVKVDDLIDQFIAVIKAESKGMEAPINAVCTTLYKAINDCKE